MKKIVFLTAWMCAATLWAEPVLQKPAQVPSGRDFVRSIQVEGGVLSAGPQKYGAQFFRLETRYLDPDPNAFVGLVAMATRFNETLRLADPADPYKGHVIANWGAGIGWVKGPHLWAVDLMGANLGNHLAFGPAFVGEHTLGKRWKFFHRTLADFFVGDTVLDSDQGFQWDLSPTVGLTAGYRIFASQHGNRNGPRASVILRFRAPKMWFIFPSIG